MFGLGFQGKNFDFESGENYLQQSHFRKMQMKQTVQKGGISNLNKGPSRSLFSLISLAFLLVELNRENQKILTN